MSFGKVAWVVVVVLCAAGALLLGLTGYSGYSIVAGAVGLAAAVNLT